MVATAEDGAFSSAPLELPFPDASASEIDRIRDAGTSLDQARPTTDEARWWWHVPHAAFPGIETGGIPVIISTSVNVDDSPGDWTELELDVSWTRTGLHVLTAQLGIACYCAYDHGTHYVHQLSTPADSSSTLASALEDAARTLIGWIAGPSDLKYWRAIAGLPAWIQ